MSVVEEIDEMIRLRAERVPSIAQMRAWKAEIERLSAIATTEFERGKDVGRAIGWDAAKRDTSKMLGLNG